MGKMNVMAKKQTMRLVIENSFDGDSLALELKCLKMLYGIERSLVTPLSVAR